jgi:hypothetical protein
MASISTQAAIKNEFELTGSGGEAPIAPGLAVAGSFLSKGSNSSAPYWTVTYDIWGSHVSASTTTWTKLYEASGSAVSTNWAKSSFTFKSPVTDADGTTVAEWNKISFRVTGSLRRTGIFSPTYTTSVYFDVFKLTANRPQVHASDEGMLIYNSAENYINMTAEGLEMVGGSVEANDVYAPYIKSPEFVVPDGGVMTAESAYGALTIKTRDVGIATSASTFEAGNLILRGGEGMGMGDTGGNIYLIPGSGSMGDGGTSGGGPVGVGGGVVVVGPHSTPRIILSGSVVPTQGSFDCEMQFKDPLGDKGVAFFTKQTTGLGAAGSGLFKVVCPNLDGRLSLGAGSWTSSNNIVIAENGRVIIQPTGGANDVAASALYELNVVGDINYSGNLTNVSDRRLKIDIEDITGSLEVVNNLEPVRFNKIGYRTIVPDTGNPRLDGMNVTQTSMSEDNTVITGSRVEIGFIAQDVLPYVPEIVMSGSVGGHYSVDYAMLTTHLVGAIKELKAEVDALKNVSHSHT